MSSSAKKLVLKSNDDETFEVDLAVAMESMTIKNMVDDVPDNDVFPLPNVSGQVLSKVLEYCKVHAGSSAKAKAKANSDDASAAKEALEKFDTEFANLDMDTLFELIVAANYLNIRGLLDLTCQTVADQIKDIKDPAEIRRLFNIENDFTPEEEAALRQENAWAFE